MTKEDKGRQEEGEVHWSSDQSIIHDEGKSRPFEFFKLTFGVNQHIKPSTHQAINTRTDRSIQTQLTILNIVTNKNAVCIESRSVSGFFEWVII